MSNTILLADDSVTIRKVVELTFMGESFELISVGSGTEAIDRLATGGLDLVIADVHMPGADGYEVCQAVKAETPSIPVLLLVGTFENFDEQRAKQVGADDHLKKPFDSQDLLGRVHALLRGSETGAEDERGAPSAETAEAAETAEIAETAETAETGRSSMDPATDLASSAAGTLGQAEASATTAPPAAPSPAAPSTGAPEATLSDESVDRIARRVVELLSEEAIRDVAWEVIPDLAEVVIKERLNELESQVE